MPPSDPTRTLRRRLSGKNVGGSGGGGAAGNGRRRSNSYWLLYIIGGIVLCIAIIPLPVISNAFLQDPPESSIWIYRGGNGRGNDWYWILKVIGFIVVCLLIISVVAVYVNFGHGSTLSSKRGHGSSLSSKSGHDSSLSSKRGHGSSLSSKRGYTMMDFDRFGIISDAYQRDMKLTNIRSEFDGNTLHPHATPMDYDMVDGKILDAFILSTSEQSNTKKTKETLFDEEQSDN